ncbi:sortilin-related receptor-like isoform X1, partial [Dinothrombium tinctorium]
YLMFLYIELKKLNYLRKTSLISSEISLYDVNAKLSIRSANIKSNLITKSENGICQITSLKGCGDLNNCKEMTDNGIKLIQASQEEEKYTSIDVLSSCSSGCLPYEFQCNDENKTCIGQQLRCDGNNDCVDNSDEMNCGIPVCNETTTIVCAKSRRCIANEYICDGTKDCIFGLINDEYNCSSSDKNCSGFLCSDGRCLPNEVRCNYIPECINAEDELNC